MIKIQTRSLTPSSKKTSIATLIHARQKRENIEEEDDDIDDEVNEEIERSALKRRTEKIRHLNFRMRG